VKDPRGESKGEKTSAKTHRGYSSRGEISETEESRSEIFLLVKIFKLAQLKTLVCRPSLNMERAY